MPDLTTLAEMEHEEPEFVPEILPVDARLSIKAAVSQLLPLFARAAAVSPSKEVVPNTAHALLEAVATSSSEAAHLRITATDGEQTVSVMVDDITVLMAGAVLVPAKRLHDILKLAPTQTVKIEVIGTAALVRSGRAQWTVQTPVGDSLNTLLDVSGIPMQTVETEPFVNALSIARRAASASSAWLGLNQLLIRNATVTGCDGGRLHRAALERFPASVDVTIPIKAVDELLKALSASQEGFFEMGYDERALVFQIGQDSIVAQRLLAPYPDIENLLLGPVFSNSYSLSFDRAEMLGAIRRVRVNADPDTAGIALLLVPGKKPIQGELQWHLAVRAKDRNGNGSQEVLECQWTGPAKSKAITVNHRYLQDFLEAYETETVFLRLGESTRTSPAPLLVEDTVLGFSGIVQQMHGAW
jgi:DNA polymerase III sliding clamp (beta) subunit (PCNA family)